MKAIILKCPDNARYHFGLAGPDTDSALSQSSNCFHSDTLFSALVILCNRIFNNTDEEEDKVSELIKFFRQGKVNISSGNYYLEVKRQGERQAPIFFLPKPSHFNAAKVELPFRKTIRSVQYISKKIWESGIPPEEWFESNSVCLLIDRKFLVHVDELDIDEAEADLIEGFYSFRTEPKIADHARKTTNNIFFQTDLFMKTSYLEDLDLYLQPHFYFLLSFAPIENNWSEKEKEAAPKMQRLIHFLIENLKEEGIGGAISTGCGQIKEVITEDWSFEFSEGKASANQWVSASLIGLKKTALESEFDQISAGEIIVRGGRNISAEEKLKRIKMIKAGALIHNKKVGTIADLHESKPYLRYGMAFPLEIPENYEYQ